MRNKLIASLFCLTALMAVTPAWAQFPTTPVLDTFTRANENPLSDGGSWTCPYLSPLSLRVVSNQAVSQATDDSGCFWNNSTFGPDVEVYVTVATLPPAGASLVLTARQDTVSENGYAIFMCTSGSCDFGSTGWVVVRFDAGVPTSLGTNAGSISAGDSIGMLIKGSTITAFKKTGGVWSSVFSVTDSTYSAAGSIGANLEPSGGASAALTDFGGGTAIVVTPPSNLGALGVGD